jgi:hypothetical protein
VPGIVLGGVEEIALRRRIWRLRVQEMPGYIKKHYL